MMCRNIFIYFLFVFAWTSINNAQPSQSNICRTYAAKHKPSAAHQKQTNVTVDDVLSLLCEGEKKLLHQPKADFVAFVGRTGTDKTPIVELLAGTGRREGVKLNGNDVIASGDAKGGITSTLLPVWYFHNKTKAYYLDCPGFEDTRGVHFDVSAAHFMRTVLNNGHQVKFVLVERHRNLVPQDPEKNAFPTLLRHVAALIKNVDKYAGSVALLASHANSSHSRQRIMADVTEFLKQAKNLTADSDEKRIIDALLDKKAPRIGFLAEERKSTAEKADFESVLAKLKFAQIRDGDFGYSVSDHSLLGVHELQLHEITSAINADVANVGRSLAAHFQRTTSSADRFADYSYMFDVLRRLEESENLPEFVERTIPKMAVRLNVTFERDVVARLRQYQDYTTFFAEVSDNKTAARMWSRGFATAALQLLRAAQAWPAFKSAFDDRLCADDVQRNRAAYDASALTATIGSLLDSPAETFGVEQTGLLAFLDQWPALNGYLAPNTNVGRDQLESVLTIVGLALDAKINATTVPEHEWLQLKCAFYEALYSDAARGNRRNHGDLIATVDRLLADSADTQFSTQQIGGLNDFLGQLPSANSSSLPVTMSRLQLQDIRRMAQTAESQSTSSSAAPSSAATCVSYVALMYVSSAYFRIRRKN